ncbi:motility protein A [Oceanirhabdus seepicola]|uniref:Motility protein A n=1 Tax=Oceanirhabdus seepicola TaxID=2828781 RepID=A0A9J6PDY7_9CLOT|nr:motility protein A [Oceanirhabdus seepicola]MCM1992656.1 motility protein A [Oceanirhabdus seepicola]
MKKQDTMTLVGIILGFGMIVFGVVTGGGGRFVDPGSLAITIGGSFGAILINFPLDQIKKIGKITAAGFKDNAFSNMELIKKFESLSKKARREGLLSLEDELTEIDDEFLKKGLQMVVDGIEPEVISGILELEVVEMEKRHGANSGVFKAWGAYAPGFGMIGTLIGLVQMMGNISDANALAVGMAKALLTTLYGSILANLIMLPMAANLDFKSAIEVNMREMMIEGILAIQSGVNPRIVEEKLSGYLSPAERLVYKNTHSDEAEVTANV